MSAGMKGLMLGRRLGKAKAGVGWCWTIAGKGVRAEVARDGESWRVVSCGTMSTLADDAYETGVGLTPESLIAGVYRLDLPPADSDTLEKLVDTRLEALIPGQAEHLLHGWQRDGRRPTNGPVLVTTAARRAVQSALNSAPAKPDLLTSPAMALHTVASAFSRSENRRSLLMVGIHADRVCLVQYDTDGSLATAKTELFNATEDALNTQEVASVLTDWLDTCEASSRPMRLSVVTHAPANPEVYDALHRAIGLPVVGLNELLTGLELEVLNLPNVLAVGAAISAADPGAHTNLLADRERESASRVRRVSYRGWIAAGLLLAASVVLLYVSDTRSAARGEAAISAAGLDGTELAALRRDLAVGGYLETSGAGPMAILDELSQVTKKRLIDGLRFERDGQVVILFTARSTKEVNQTVNALAGMQTLDDVRLRQQVTKGRDRIEYSVVARPAARYFDALGPVDQAPPRSQDQPAGKRGST